MSRLLPRNRYQHWAGDAHAIAVALKWRFAKAPPPSLLVCPPPPLRTTSLSKDNCIDCYGSLPNGLNTPHLLPVLGHRSE